jgi:hypothetical protein
VRGRRLAMTIGALVLAGGSLAGCTRDDEWPGTVTSLTPTFCVGRHHALGDCFPRTATVRQASLAVGDCVQVWVGTTGTDAGRLLAVRKVRAARHRLDCPRHFVPYAAR